MFHFSGRIAVVTGAGGGIGQAVSPGSSKAGAKVLAVDLDCELGAETARRIEARGGGALFVAADVSRPERLVNYVEKAIRPHRCPGHPDQRRRAVALRAAPEPLRRRSSPDIDGRSLQPAGLS